MGKRRCVLEATGVQPRETKPSLLEERKGKGIGPLPVLGRDHPFQWMSTRWGNAIKEWGEPWGGDHKTAAGPNDSEAPSPGDYHYKFQPLKGGDWN